ncbi:MAG TPA: hypothetical protein VGJ94_01945 [Syntrophorhabdaceae bacterium]
MGKYEYVDKPPGTPWVMEVRKDGSCKGNIRKSPYTGQYQFFRGKVNAIRALFEETRIDALIEKIEELDL